MSSSVPDNGLEVRIKIGGPAGFGIKAAGQTFARLFMRAGYRTFDLTEYPSLIKGGHNSYHLRVSNREIFSHVEPVDVLVALDEATVGLHLNELSQGAAIIFDPKDFDISEIEGVPDHVCGIPVPMTEIVAEQGGVKIMRNTAANAAVLGYLGFPLETLADSLREQFAHKAPEIAEQNITIATAAYEYGTKATCPHEPLAPLADVDAQILVDGNEAIGLGALAAGLGMYCAYPMTPASSILHFMARHGDDMGVVVKHTEDELAAMNMVVGASFAGARAMCGTSGGGFALMTEAYGLAGVTESPCVVAMISRPGPATGLPTWTEQSDLRMVLHAAQGEFPRVVLAPGDRQDSFDLAWQAFNIADQLQTPVIILGDAYLSDHRQSVAPFDSSAVTIDRGETITEGEVTNYKRFKITDSGVAPRAIPGVVGADMIANSYDHDEHGWASEGAEMRIAQNDRRARKQELARELVPAPQRYGPDEADVSIVLYGSTKMPVREAMKWLEADGVSVNMLQIVTLLPFPTDQVASFIGKAKKSVCIEGNMTGQLQGLIREKCLIDVDHALHRYDGRPISPEQVTAFIKEVL
ncbi:MAG: 2-oxoacid:acceptor oxidoreductase subunit alpha [Actinomycetota bacterium]|jgi:2-oxoglutarate ferredoxin oxidoreductase subunit alpha|nr:2-oxoacid:acceptor oxidoreductase subunit alpha [Actinomycetota bacterium]